MANDTKYNGAPLNAGASRTVTPMHSTYLPNIAGPVQWQAEIVDDRIASLSITHNRVNARFSIGDRGLHGMQFSEGGKTYLLEFGDDDGR